MLALLTFTLLVLFFALRKRQEPRWRRRRHLVMRALLLIWVALIILGLA